MIKKLFIFLLLVLLLVYLVAAMTIFNSKPSEVVCKDVDVVLKDTMNFGFINKKELIGLLKQKGISPIGKTMNEINTDTLERILEKQPFIEEANCYRTPGNEIGITVKQRVPLLRVMANSGENYYVDTKGHIMPVPNKASHVAVATGFIDKKFAQKELYELGEYLHTHPLWDAQVEQINITANREIELVPRVGEQIIFLGKPGAYDRKFKRLKFFYENGLNKVGWNKYSRISLEFDNQIICTKR